MVDPDEGRAPRPEGRPRHPDRAAGRELALLALCHLESYRGDERPRALEIFWSHPPTGSEEGSEELRAMFADAKAVEFARRMLAVVGERAAEIDAAIEATSRSWRLARMDRVDRNVLRLVAAESLGLSETPRPVVVSEAVRLASRYGSERSAPFVNGLAQALAAKLRGEAARGK